MTITDRRTFIQVSGVSAAMMPFGFGLIKNGRGSILGAEQSYFVRDQRYQSSITSAKAAEREANRIVDVNEDVAPAYLELEQISKAAKIGAIAGVTAHTAKDILATLFLPPEYKLTFEHAVDELRQGRVVKLWAWRFERVAGEAVA